MKRIIFALAIMSANFAFGQTGDLGAFTGHTDVGSVGKPGAVVFDKSKQEYRITGGGANMWSTNDAFQFVWKKMSGDVSLAADLEWIGTSAQ